MLGLVVGSGLAAYHSFRQGQMERLQFAQRDHRPARVIGGLTAPQYQSLGRLNYHSGMNPVLLVNHDRSTLNPKSWQKNRVIYQQLDAARRTSASNTAFLCSRNHADTRLRSYQEVQPAGWHPNRDNNLIYNRGHLIAYSLTGGINPQTGHYQSGLVGDQDNPRNLFTETDFTNQVLQTHYEDMVRHAIENGKHVIYQATPVFRGSDVVARGINLQALSTDGTLNFNVYLFNIEPGTTLDYQDGSYIANPSFRVWVPTNMGADQNDDSGINGQVRVSGHYSHPYASEPRHYDRLIK